MLFGGLLGKPGTKTQSVTQINLVCGLCMHLLEVRQHLFYQECLPPLPPYPAPVQASDSKFWVVVCLFAAATPLGIAIGYASSVLGHGPVSAAMSALASGTFLYVALNEVIPKELEHPDGHRLAKVAALLLGFGLMSLLAVWA